jgi:hypothetical protein
MDATHRTDTIIPHAACTVTLDERLENRSRIIEIEDDSYPLKRRRSAATVSGS